MGASELETLDLVAGSYEPEEAKEILVTLLDSKIRFHSLKSMSSYERTGKVDPISETKLTYFREARKQVDEFIAEAAALKKRIRLDSTINMKWEF